MMTKHPNSDRGHTKLDWLDARHSFSFGHHYDPRYLGVGALRVLNHDKIKPKGGFPTHPHANMEIITIPLSGQLSHRDNTGVARTIDRNHIQVMTAGSGIRHSEFNPSSEIDTEMLQIWLRPSEENLPPAYADHAIDPTSVASDWRVLVSHDPHRGHKIHANAEILRTEVPAGETRTSPVRPLAYAYVITGEAEINHVRLEAGDAMIIQDETDISVRAIATSARQTLDILLFQL